MKLKQPLLRIAIASAVSLLLFSGLNAYAADVKCPPVTGGDSVGAIKYDKADHMFKADSIAATGSESWSASAPKAALATVNGASTTVSSITYTALPSLAFKVTGSKFKLACRYRDSNGNYITLVQASKVYSALKSSGEWTDQGAFHVCSEIGTNDKCKLTV